MGAVTVVHLKANGNYHVNQLKSLVLHPQYQTGQTPYFDMAVIVLQEPIVFNSRVFPACLHVNDSIPEVQKRRLKILTGKILTFIHKCRIQVTECIPPLPWPLAGCRQLPVAQSDLSSTRGAVVAAALPRLPLAAPLPCAVGPEAASVLHQDDG